MAAAVILIPEMLSGPDREAADKPAAEQEGAIKTYTIDLSQSPGVSASSGVETANRAPPPEETPPSTSPTPAEQTPPEPESQALPESIPPAPADMPEESTPPPTSSVPTIAAERSAPEPQPKPEPAPARAESKPAETKTAEAKTQAPPQAKPEAPARPVASTSSAPTSATPATIPSGKGWAVQLGSYSSEATAQRLMNEWRAKGQSAFVMPVKSGGKTLYRVRIGPARDRAGAEAVLKSVKASNPGAAVVAHP